MPQSGIILYIISLLYIVAHKLNVVRVYFYYCILFVPLINLTNCSIVGLKSGIFLLRSEYGPKFNIT